MWPPGTTVTLGTFDFNVFACASASARVDDWCRTTRNWRLTAWTPYADCWAITIAPGSAATALETSSNTALCLSLPGAGSVSVLSRIGTLAVWAVSAASCRNCSVLRARLSAVPTVSRVPLTSAGIPSAAINVWAGVRRVRNSKIAMITPIRRANSTPAIMYVLEMVMRSPLPSFFRKTMIFGRKTAQSEAKAPMANLIRKLAVVARAGISGPRAASRLSEVIGVAMAGLLALRPEAHAYGRRPEHLVFHNPYTRVRLRSTACQGGRFAFGAALQHSPHARRTEHPEAVFPQGVRS